jgi:hypothetical protein
VALNVSRFLTGTSTALPSGVTGTGELAISPNGDLLVGITSAAAVIAWRPPRPGVTFGH